MGLFLKELCEVTGYEMVLPMNTGAEAVETAVIGGGFGFAVLKLDDGRVIAHIIEPYSQAERAGMAWGAEIIRWDGQPIHEAVAAVPTVWAARPHPKR